MAKTQPPPDATITDTDNRAVPCPNCGAGLALRWKYCIRCGLRHDPAAFERLATLDVERRAIVASLLPVPASGTPPIQSAFAPAAAKPPEPAAERPLAIVEPSGQLAAATKASSPLTDTLPASRAWLLKSMVYGGGTLMAVGGLIYLREIVLESPLLQLALLTGLMVGLLGLGVRGSRRQPDDLVARGWLWLGALLLPLDFWAGVYHGVLPTGVGWGYAAACAVVYWLLSVWLTDRGLPHLAIMAALTAGVWFGLDRLTSPLAFALAVAMAAGFATWSVTYPSHVTATAGWWWGGATMGLCASFAPALDELWLSGVAGLGCLAMGRLVAGPAASWVWVGSGLGLLTVAYGRWLVALELSAGWMTAGWAVWLLALSIGQVAAARWEARGTAVGAGCFQAPLWWAEHLLAGTLGLWALVVVAGAEAALLTETPWLTVKDATGHWLAWVLVMGWGGWRLHKALTWLPLGLVTLAGLAGGGTLVMCFPTQLLAVLVLPGLLCIVRLGVELLGVYFGRQYSTEVDTSFGLDFGLAHHPAIVPSRVLLDLSASLCLAGLLALSAASWKLMHTLGLGLVIGYGGLCWLTNGIPVAQRAYALAMWSLAYVGLVSTGCGVGNATLFDVMPWVALVAAVSSVGAARALQDEPMLRWALRQTSVGILGVGGLAALAGILSAQGHEFGHGLALGAAAGAGWTIAVLRRAGWIGLAATLCGGLACTQAVRCAGGQLEVLPLVGVLYGYTTAWLGWRWLRRSEADDGVWSALALGGQVCLWVAAVGGLAAIPPYPPSGSNLATGVTLICAAGAMSMASVIVREDGLSDLYAVGGLVWGGTAYVWWLAYVGLPVFTQVAYTALPYGALVIGIGWLKQRFRHGHPALSGALMWLGSFIFCVPVVFQAWQRRLAGSLALPYDIVADIAALVALAVGSATGWHAPRVVGGLALSCHLVVVVFCNVPWGDIPYGVYLALTGLTLFITGTWLWRRYR